VLREMLNYTSGRLSLRLVESERRCSNLWQFASETANCEGAFLAVPQFERLSPEKKSSSLGLLNFLYQTLKFFYNKECWEELMAYFPFIRQRRA
jgi:hypothetical protein